MAQSNFESMIKMSEFEWKKITNLDHSIALDAVERIS